MSLTSNTASTADALPGCPLDPSAVAKLLRVRPELRLDGKRPTAAELADRLAGLWLSDETVVYIGLAGTSVQGRVNAYYRTPLGARSPHAGGWPVKTLSVLPSLFVHYAACADPAAAEQRMLDVFTSQVSPDTRAKLHDPEMPVPFANLEHGKGQRKRHGITGARAPRKPSAAVVTADRETERSLAPRPATTVGASVLAPAANPAALEQRAAPTVVHAGPMRSQRITEKDIQAGRVRFPSSAKPVFPSERTEVAIVLRGEQMTVPRHPHYGPDKERSGVLSVGRQRLAALVHSDDVLSVSTVNGRVALD